LAATHADSAAAAASGARSGGGGGGGEMTSAAADAVLRAAVAEFGHIFDIHPKVSNTFKKQIYLYTVHLIIFYSKTIQISGTVFKKLN